MAEGQEQQPTASGPPLEGLGRSTHDSIGPAEHYTQCICPNFANLGATTKATEDLIKVPLSLLFAFSYTNCSLLGLVRPQDLSTI